MIKSAKWMDFIDRTGRKPRGKQGIKMYNDPRGHYKSFRLIMETLNLSGEDRYFEVGCGGGILLRQALEKASSAAAIDHSQDMVTLAGKNNRMALQSGRLDLSLGDAARLPWEDASFTAGACAFMFFFVEQPENALAEACRVLRPGGRFVMVTMARSITARLFFSWMYSLRLYTDKQMTLMFKSAGFRDVNVKKSMLGLIQFCTARK